MVHENVTQHAQAIRLRQRGFTYTEILKEIPIAKSTLSLWLRRVQLSKRIHQRLTTKKLEAAKRGGRAKKAQKEATIQTIKNLARAEIGALTDRELWLIGISLYWGEGSKEKPYAPGSGLVFTNSDIQMARIYVTWLKRICRVSEEDLKFELYIHETNYHSRRAMVLGWEENLRLGPRTISKIYVKHNKIGTKRKNTEALYYGTIRIKVARSSGLNRKVAGWIEGILAAV